MTWWSLQRGTTNGTSTVKEVQSVFRVLGYQCPFIPHYTNIARPLMALTKKNHTFSWTPECRTALDTLIDAITKGPTLAQPDLEQPFFFYKLMHPPCSG